MPSHDDPDKRSVLTATNSRHEQTSNTYEPLQPWPHLAGILLLWERSNYRPRHRAHSAGGGNRAATWVERTLAEGRRVARKGLGREIAPLSPSLPGFHSRHYGLDSSRPSVRTITPTTLRHTMPPDKERPTTDYAADLVDHLHDIHNYALQHLTGWRLGMKN
jgi:hypothetical protein